MAEEVSTTEDLREALLKLTHEIVDVLGGVLLETAGATLAQEAIRSSGEAGLHYREACRAKSRSEFYAGLPAVTDCVEATLYWLTLAQDCGQLSPEKTEPLIALARETSARLTAARISSSRRSRGE